jgi:putative FmdB family regulatory protein
MPIYEYRCKDCGEHFEKRQSVSDDPLKTCEKCGGSLEKQWSLSGFQFKGGGWYVTDYAGKNRAKDSAGKGEKASGGESTEKTGDASKTKSEVAPAAPKDGGSKKE